MNPAILPLPFDPAKLRGLSERLLQSHHQNNYSGAVKRLHAIRAELATLAWSSAPGYRINGLKREELIAANSMGLHELYFASLGGDGKLKAAGKPAGFGAKAYEDYNSRHYHQPSDEFQADWDFTALQQAAEYGFLLGRDVANQDKLPDWRAGDQFHR